MVNNSNTLKILSLTTFGIAVIGLMFLIKINALLSTNIFGQVIQFCMVILMIWARITFGIRSFHATANTTKGGLVTQGPYRIFRHPVYASVIYFVWAGILTHCNLYAFVFASLITISLIARMVIEEKFLLDAYEEYKTYCKITSRLIPFVF